MGISLANEVIYYPEFACLLLASMLVSCVCLFVCHVVYCRHTDHSLTAISIEVDTLVGLSQGKN